MKLEIKFEAYLILKRFVTNFLNLDQTNQTRDPSIKVSTVNHKSLVK